MTRIGAAIVLVTLVAAVAGPWLVPFDPAAQELALRLEGPTGLHWLGLDELGRERRPEAIIGCDCILRRLEAQHTQGLREMSRLMARHRVVGFSTYGEQFHAVHVNQTFTGVAIYPPEETEA